MIYTPLYLPEVCDIMDSINDDGFINGSMPRESNMTFLYSKTLWQCHPWCGSQIQRRVSRHWTTCYINSLHAGIQERGSDRPHDGHTWVRQNLPCVNGEQRTREGWSSRGRIRHRNKLRWIRLRPGWIWENTEWGARMRSRLARLARMLAPQMKEKAGVVQDTGEELLGETESSSQEKTELVLRKPSEDYQRASRQATKTSTFHNRSAIYHNLKLYLQLLYTRWSRQCIWQRLYPCSCLGSGTIR